MKQPGERSIRAMRDRVYEDPTTDSNWDGCKEHWLKPDEVKWLQDQCARLDLPKSLLVIP